MNLKIMIKYMAHFHPIIFIIRKLISCSTLLYIEFSIHRLTKVKTSIFFTKFKKIKIYLKKQQKLDYIKGDVCEVSIASALSIYVV